MRAPTNTTSGGGSGGAKGATKRSFAQASTKDFIYLYEDPKCMVRIFWYTAPIACLVLLFDRHWPMPIFVQIGICLFVSFFLSFLHLFTSRLASLVTLYAGSMVVNLNTERAPRITLYDANRHDGCRILRQACSGLGMEVEIRSIPDQTEGVAQPWLIELEALIRTQQNSGQLPISVTSGGLPLPFIVGLDKYPSIAPLQGDGPRLAKELLHLFALDPKESFPMSLDSKLLVKLSTLAGLLRQYLPWGTYARPIAWDRINALRRDAQRSGTGSVPIPSFDASRRLSTYTIMSLPTITDEASTNTQAYSPRSSTRNMQLSPTSTSRSTTPKLGHVLTSYGSSSSSPIPSPSHASSSAPAPFIPSLLEPSASSLRLRAHLERGVAVRAGALAPSVNGSNSISPLADSLLLPDLTCVEELHPLTIYGSEAHAHCRPVFELCCSLQIPYVLLTCAEGSVHRAKLILDYGDEWKLPTIIDTNTNQTRIGAPACADYILHTYTDWEA